MSSQPSATVKPYNDTVLRVEHRPKKDLHSRDELLRMLDAYVAAGVDCWWYSACGTGGVPLYPSKRMPYREQSDPDLLPWLAEKVHERGMTFATWQFIATAPPLAAERPDLRVRFFDGDRRSHERHDHFLCVNSDYRDYLFDFAGELVRDIGFDCVYYDGVGQLNECWPPHEDGSAPMACCCPRCSELFEAATGERMPQHMDHDDPVFRRWQLWRGENLRELMQDLTSHIRSQRADATVAFYYPRRFAGGAGDALDARLNVPALVASESGRHIWRIPFDSKRARATQSGDHCPEMWTFSRDGAFFFVGAPCPDPDPIGLQFHGAFCMTNGSMPSMGCGPEKQELLATLSHYFGQRRPYVGGRCVAHVAVLVDDRSLRFEHVPGLNHNTISPIAKGTHGLGFLLDHAHIPYDVLLAESLSDEELDRFQAVIVSEMPCLSDATAERLRAWCERGGVLIALGDNGTQDELGFPRPGAASLDALLGIAEREGVRGPAIVAPQHEALRHDLPPRFLFSGQARQIGAAADAAVLATGTIDATDSELWTRKPDAGVHEARVDAVMLARPVGKGQAITCTANLAEIYAEIPNRRAREVLRRLLEEVGGVARPFVAEAPTHVMVQAWRQDERVSIHLLDRPAPLSRLRGGANGMDHDWYWPEDFDSQGPVHIRWPGVATAVHSPTGAALDWRVEHDVTLIDLPRFTLHEVIVIEGA